MKLLILGLAATSAIVMAQQEGCYDFDCKTISSQHTNIIKGKDNLVYGSNNAISGYENRVKGQFNLAAGTQNIVKGEKNAAFG